MGGVEIPGVEMNRLGGVVSGTGSTTVKPVVASLLVSSDSSTSASVDTSFQQATLLRPEFFAR